MHTSQVKVDLNMECHSQNLEIFVSGALYYYTVHMNDVCEEMRLATAGGISSPVQGDQSPRFLDSVDISFGSSLASLLGQ